LDTSNATRSRALRRYTLLQIPELILLILLLYWLGDWLGIALWIRILIVIIWLLKDVILFFWVWPAYVFHARTEHDTMVNKTGETVEQLKPRGYISIEGELWQAELVPPHMRLAKGKPVRVVGGKGMLLKVIPL